MNRSRKILLGLFTAILLSACVTPEPNMRLNEVISTPVQPEPGKALVYFLRPDPAAFTNFAAVYDGDEFIGFAPYNSKLAYQATPGEHLFMVVSEAADFMTADLEAGKTYYAQVVPRMGAWRARYSLWAISKEQLGTAEVRGWIDAASPVTNKPEAFEWAKNNEGSVMQKKEAYYAKWITKADDLRPHLKAEDGE